MLSQIKRNLFCHQQNTSKFWTTWSLGLPAHNFLSHLQFFQLGKLWCWNVGIWCYINYPWYWSYRWSNSSVLCSICKITFVGAGNLQVITNKFWYKNLCGLYALHLDPVLCIVLISWEVEALNLWRGDEIFEINFGFKWKQPATKGSSTNNFFHA